MDVEAQNLPRRTQAERRALAEEALLEAATSLIAERGLSGTSLAQIGERAGYSRGLVNHHFGTKEALVERLAARAHEHFRALLDGVSAPTGLEGLVAVVERYLLLYDRPNDEARSMQVMWGEGLAESSPGSFRVPDERARRIVSEWVARGHEDGSVSQSVSPESFAFVVVGLVRGVAAQLVTAPGEVDVDALRDQCRATVEAVCRPAQREHIT